MSCPDWRRLLAHRFAADGEVPAAWPQARAHLEDCPPCRKVALAIDPTLAFRDAAAWTASAQDSAEIVQAVRTLRRTSALENRTGEASGKAAGRLPSRDRGPMVAAVLFALVLAMQPASTSRQEEAAVFGPPAPVPEVAASELRQAARPTAPAIEGVDRPEARVYEWGADDLSVVMVVDESLDV